jgi:undecaprenyl-diphosphatase
MLKRRVEHEALVMNTVSAAGTRSPKVLGIGVTNEGAGFIVEERVSGRRLSLVPSSEITDDIVRSVFRSVRSVHSTQTAHHALTLENMLLDDDGEVWLVDYDEAESAAGPRQRSRDIAEVLVAMGADCRAGT